MFLVVTIRVSLIASGGNVFDDVSNLDHHRMADLLVEESSFGDKEIVFIFTRDFNANENDGKFSWELYIITYDRILSEFTKCEYEKK